jgi:methionyl aminopeptidase
MRVSNQFDSNAILILKDQFWLDRQRVAGKVVAEALSFLENLVKEKSTLTLLEMSKAAEELIIKNNCSPTFKGYKGFPEAVCCSVNNQLVHGIPENYQLKEGDVVSFDLGATFEEVIADSALTCIYGEAKDPAHFKLIEDTKFSLESSINKIKIGNRLGIIGETIYKIGKKNNYGVVSSYGGHGICLDSHGHGMPHAFPFVSNKDEAGNGVRFQAGMTIAIEPLFVLGGDNFTYIGEDSWTVYSRNISCHFEHTIFIHEDKVEIITLRENENRI